MALGQTKGMSRSAFKKLELVYKPTPIKLEDSMARIQRDAGKLDVIDYIRRNLVDD